MISKSQNANKLYNLFLSIYHDLYILNNVTLQQQLHSIRVICLDVHLFWLHFQIGWKQWCILQSFLSCRLILSFWNLMMKVH